MESAHHRTPVGTPTMNLSIALISATGTHTDDTKSYVTDRPHLVLTKCSTALPLHTVVVTTTLTTTRSVMSGAPPVPTAPDGGETSPSMSSSKATAGTVSNAAPPLTGVHGTLSGSRSLKGRLMSVSTLGMSAGPPGGAHPLTGHSLKGAVSAPKPSFPPYGVLTPCKSRA